MAKGVGDDDSVIASISSHNLVDRKWPRISCSLVTHIYATLPYVHLDFNSAPSPRDAKRIFCFGNQNDINTEGVRGCRLGMRWSSALCVVYRPSQPVTTTVENIKSDKQPNKCHYVFGRTREVYRKCSRRPKIKLNSTIHYIKLNVNCKTIYIIIYSNLTLYRFDSI